MGVTKVTVIDSANNVVSTRSFHAAPVHFIQVKLKLNKKKVTERTGNWIEFCCKNFLPPFSFNLRYFLLELKNFQLISETLL